MFCFASILSFVLALTLVPEAPAEGTDESPPTIERRVFLMGTTMLLEIWADDRGGALEASEAAITAMESVNRKLSTWLPDSEISRFNTWPLGEPFEFSPEVGTVLERALTWQAKTEGAFSLCMRALIDAWGLETGGRVPSDEEIVDAANANATGLDFDLPRAIRRTPRSGIAVGGFGKGVALDMAVATLRAKPVRRARIDFGGQIAAFTQDDETRGSDGTRWSLEIAHPSQRDRAVVKVTCPNGSVATSGNSERAIVVEGRRFGHILNPRTGTPCPDFGSVTVYCPRAIDADCLSTALYVLGPDKALAFAERHAEVEVVVLERIEKGLRLRSSPGFEEYLTFVDGDVFLASSSDSSDADH